MEHTSIEDFQRFRARHPSSRSNRFSSRPPSLQPQDTAIQSVEHEYDDTASLSGSAHHSSGPDEAVFDAPLSRHSSPRTSHHSDENDSICFSDPRGNCCLPEDRPSSPYTPLKVRSPFRNPSSVRAMQMETTPPPYIPSSSFQHHGMSPTSSRHATPRSARSSHRGSRTSPSKMSPTKSSNLKKEYPLVLLHVTLLPIPQLFPVEIMEQVLPNYLLENWKILREKATDTVLERGVLIPHPKEDYDLMEERLLESLDLRTPRILKCGHFHLKLDEEAGAAGSDDENFDAEENDEDICADCGKRVRDGRYGSGTGSRRWDIKVYAANGLMRAGAWGAAWREMERVDVEIIPWMDDEMKRELVLRTEEERKHAALLHEQVAGRDDPQPTMDEERMREIYGNGGPAFVDVGEKQPQQPVKRQPNEIPLQHLLKDYILAATQDGKNIAIFFLSIFVLYLSMASRQTHTASIASHQPHIPSSLSSIPISAPTRSTSSSIAPALDSSIVDISEIPTTSMTLQEEATEVPSSPSPEIANEDIMDAIEARFEFSGE
ncbi:MAG: hypothetical protein Q9170_000623 [Blastenia crenularia]